MSKNLRRTPEEWSPHEVEVDTKMKVVRNDKENFYIASIPWKTNLPELRNNLSMVRARQERTNSDEALKDKGILKEAVDAIFLAQLEKGYIRETTNPKEIH